MLKLKKVLLPVDYSVRCLSAADCVRALAARMAVEVTVLHVRDTQAQRRADEEVIGAFSDRLAGIAVHFSEVAGDPAQQIIEYARSCQTELIVMPTRAHGAVRRLLLGSVTTRVLRGVHCPVWTGSFNRQVFGAWPQITTVICGVDLGPRSVAVLRWASELADSFCAKLIVIHANTQLTPARGVVHDPEWRARVAVVLRAQLFELLANAGVEAEIRLTAGAPAAALSGSAERLGADLLVIGRGRKGLLGRLRSSAFGIIRRSPCGVVSIEERQDGDHPGRTLSVAGADAGAKPVGSVEERAIRL